MWIWTSRWILEITPYRSFQADGWRTIAVIGRNKQNDVPQRGSRQVMVIIWTTTFVCPVSPCRRYRPCRGDIRFPKFPFKSLAPGKASELESESCFFRWLRGWMVLDRCRRRGRCAPPGATKPQRPSDPRYRLTPELNNSLSCCASRVVYLYIYVYLGKSSASGKYEMVVFRERSANNWLLDNPSTQSPVYFLGCEQTTSVSFHRWIARRK